MLRAGRIPTGSTEIEEITNFVVDPDANTITVTTNGFSDIVLGAPVPEPSTALMILGGLLALSGRTRSAGRGRS